jgi:hypothetical protein
MNEQVGYGNGMSALPVQNFQIRRQMIYEVDTTTRDRVTHCIEGWKAEEEEQSGGAHKKEHTNACSSSKHSWTRSLPC